MSKEMNKEQTPIDALNMLRALIESNEEGDDYRISTEAVKICLDEIESLLTKEKEQREELIKEVDIQCYTARQFSLVRLSKSQMETMKKEAEQYYNKVIKPNQ